MEDIYREIISDQKKSNKRMFVICMTELIIIFSMFIGFLIYESQFETVTDESTIEQIQYDIENSSQTGVIN